MRFEKDAVLGESSDGTSVVYEGFLKEPGAQVLGPWGTAWRCVVHTHIGAWLQQPVGALTPHAFTACAAVPFAGGAVRH